MRILADVNVPEEYVAALRGDGHDVTYSRRIEGLGPVLPAPVSSSARIGLSLATRPRIGTELAGADCQAPTERATF
jgi:hypothetical protein